MDINAKIRAKKAQIYYLEGRLDLYTNEWWRENGKVRYCPQFYRTRTLLHKRRRELYFLERTAGLVPNLVEDVKMEGHEYDPRTSNQ